MRRLVLASSLFVLAVAGGCSTTTPDDDGGGDEACGPGLSDEGSFTATIGSASFAANCYDVQVREITTPSGAIDILTVTGLVYEPEDPQGEFVGLVTGAVGTGVYSVENRDQVVTSTSAEAEYALNGTSRLADEGTVTITQYSDTRVRGSFDVELTDGTAMTGSFDVTY